jgi:nucleotide-binding universal stress UspA family protein
MSLKNLMVHLDAGERAGVRLALAVSLARKHDARLIGVFGQLAQAQHVGVVATWPSAEYVAARDASKAAFEKAAAGLARAEWIDTNRGSETEVLRLVTNQARHADLVILGQRERGGNNLLPEDFVMDVVLDCGRPVLVIPYAGDFTAVGKRPMIAWNDAREAAHALERRFAAAGRLRGRLGAFLRHPARGRRRLLRQRSAPPRRPWRHGQAGSAGGGGFRHHGPAAQPHQRPQRPRAAGCASTVSAPAPGAQGGGGVPGPARVVQHAARQRHGVGLAFGEDGLGLRGSVIRPTAMVGRPVPAPSCAWASRTW